MAKDIIELVEPHTSEIVRICRVLEADGRELLELNKLVDERVSLESMINSLQKEHVKVIPVQNYLVELNRRTGSPCPIILEFKRLRRLVDKHLKQNDPTKRKGSVRLNKC